MRRLLKIWRRSVIRYSYMMLVKLERDAAPLVQEHHDLNVELEKVFTKYPNGRGMDEQDKVDYLALRTQNDEISLMLSRLSIQQNRLNILIQKHLMDALCDGEGYDIGFFNKAGGRFLFQPTPEDR